MSKRLLITVHGRVQRVGYRDQVAETARQLGIKGTVKNLDDTISVQVIAEGEEKALDEFLKKINIQDYPVNVEKIESKEEKATGEFQYFKISRGDPMEEVAGRMDLAAKYLYSMNKKQDETIGILHSMDKKHDKTIEILNNMDTKQDENTNVLKNFSEETHASFDLMEKKYGAISEKLGKLDKMADSFDELVGILKMFKPKE